MKTTIAVIACLLGASIPILHGADLPIVITPANMATHGFTVTGYEHDRLEASFPDIDNGRSIPSREYAIVITPQSGDSTNLTGGVRFRSPNDPKSYTMLFLSPSRQDLRQGQFSVFVHASKDMPLGHLALFFADRRNEKVQFVVKFSDFIKTEQQGGGYSPPAARPSKPTP